MIEYQKKLIEEYQDRLDYLRRKNDNGLNDIETARIRGQIKEVKTMLARLGTDE